MIDQRFQQHHRALAFLAIGEISRAKKLMMWGTYGKGGVEHCYGTCPEHQLPDVERMITFGSLVPSFRIETRRRT